MTCYKCTRTIVLCSFVTMAILLVITIPQSDNGTNNTVDTLYDKLIEKSKATGKPIYPLEITEMKRSDDDGEL